MDSSIKNKPTRHYPTGLSAHPYSIYFSTSIFIASEVCPRSDPGLGLSLPTPASKKYFIDSSAVYRDNRQESYPV